MQEKVGEQLVRGALQASQSAQQASSEALRRTAAAAEAEAAAGEAPEAAAGATGEAATGLVRQTADAVSGVAGAAAESVQKVLQHLSPLAHDPGLGSSGTIGSSGTSGGASASTATSASEVAGELAATGENFRQIVGEVSQVADQLGEQLGEQVAEPLKKTLSDVVKAILDVSQQFTDKAAEIATNTESFAQNALTQAVDQLKNLVTSTDNLTAATYRLKSATESGFTAVTNYSDAAAESTKAAIGHLQTSTDAVATATVEGSKGIIQTLSQNKFVTIAVTLAAVSVIFFYRKKFCTSSSQSISPEQLYKVRDDLLEKIGENTKNLVQSNNAIAESNRNTEYALQQSEKAYLLIKQQNFYLMLGGFILAGLVLVAVGFLVRFVVRSFHNKQLQDTKNQGLLQN